MWKKALDADEKISLDQRIEYLTRAANSFASSLDSNNSAFNIRNLVGGGLSGRGTRQALQEQQVTVQTLRSNNAQIQEQLDVATIQKRILTTIAQSQDADLEHAKMDALKYTLVNISDLYNEYACPLNLFDVCLLILETCRRNDLDTINVLWKSIICEEVLPCQTDSSSVVNFLTRLKRGSLLEEEVIAYGDGAANDLQMFETGEWIPCLRNRVTSLGKELFGKGADYTFPIDLIVRELEGMMMDNNYVLVFGGSSHCVCSNVFYFIPRPTSNF
jgi:nuclear pore complex protein Nup155